jgi:PAS domain S-box-containing protein
MLAQSPLSSDSEREVARLREELTKLRGEKRQYEALLNQAPMGIYVVDADFRVCEVNPVAEPVFAGIPGGVLGRDFDEIIHIIWPKAFADEVVRHFRHTFETGKPYLAPPVTEERADRGVTESYEWRIDRVPLSDGRFGAVCYFHEITRSSRDRQIAQRLASIVETSDDAIVIKNLDGIILSWNDGAERLFGYTADEAIGKPISMLIPEDRLDEEPDIIRRIRAGERIDHYETIRRRKDGSSVEISLSVSPLRDGADTIIGASKIARDISLRRQAETAQDLTQRLALIVESSDDAIISKSLDGIIMSCNGGAERLFGYSAAEAIGKPVSMLIPEDRLNEEPGIIQRIRLGERVDHYETIRRRKDGSLVDISLTVSPVRNAAGVIIGASKIARDISVRKQAEATRHLLLSELNHRVKNTLAVVQAIVQQTLSSTKDPGDFATRFSGRIQSLARVHSLLTDSTWQGADLRALIRDQLLQGSVDETKLTAWGPTVLLPPQMTLHVALMLHELGTNSTKHGALSTASGWVTVHWSVKGEMLHLKWEERGGPAVKAPIARGFGTRLIEQSAKSEGGEARMLFEAKGVIWEIMLPLPSSQNEQAPSRTEVEMVTPAPAGPEAVVEPQPILAGKRVLVIEDEPLIALSLVSSLEAAGAAVARPVGTEKEALTVIEEAEVDVALLDANLHGRPVREIAAALTRRKIPFIFVTGYGRDSLPESFKSATVLAKPYSDTQLLDAVTELTTRSGVVRLKA